MSQNKLRLMQKRFIETVDLVAVILSKFPSEIKRDEYIRTTVDGDIEDRLNKVELNLLGGFKTARNLYFDSEESRTRKPKILVYDIETLPMEAYIWSPYQDNIPLNMIKTNWSVLSFSAKWYGEDEIFYSDVRKQKNLRDDKRVLQDIWKLMDEADITLAHNGDAFDFKKLNARFLLNGMQPPSSFKKMDTKKMAKKHFGFTSNSLAWLTDKLCTTYKKQKHSEMAGFTMWEECMAKNPRAFELMEEYNKYDVLSLEELFTIMLPWENASLFYMYNTDDQPRCTCGSTEFKKAGFHFTPTNKYQKYRCTSCGSEHRDNYGQFTSKAKKQMKNTKR